MGQVVENDKIIRLLKTLVEIESPSKREEKLKKLVKDYLTSLNYKFIEGEYYLATVSESELIVATHLDTVPIKAQFSFDGKYAYGTGVCDAKGSLAALLIAAERGLNYTLAFFCDEEEDGLGSKEFVNTWKKGKYVVVMEPTGLKIAYKHYGNFELMVEVLGKEAHGAFPEAGINAIEKAFSLYQELKKRGFKAVPLRIEGGGSEYVIPSRCKIKFEVFLAPEERLSQYLDKLEFVKTFGTYELDHVYEGYISGRVVEYLEKALQMSDLPLFYTEMKSWTDALNLKDRFDVVVWGPGELEKCHTGKERINIEEIKKTIQVLINLDKISLPIKN